MRTMALAALGWLCCTPLLCHGLERVGMAHGAVHSPDGTAIAYLAEHRLDDAREYTITVMLGMDLVYPRVTYSLTPQYGTAVQSPSGSGIAYRARDFTKAAPVYRYAPEVAWPHPYPVHSHQVGMRGSVVQWSQDGAFLRLGPDVPVFGWWAFTVDGNSVSAEDAAEITWADPVVPSDLPDFMTQRTPTVSRAMPLVWGVDAKALYVADAEGIWRATLTHPYMTSWDMIHPLAHVQSLAMSPSGELLVSLAGTGEVREVFELHIGGDEMVARNVGTGFDVTFSPTTDTYYFGNNVGYYAVRPGAEPLKLAFVAGHPDRW